MRQKREPLPFWKNNDMQRKEPERLEFIIRRALKGSFLEEGITRVHVYEAFDKVSGLSGYVLRKTYEKGILTCYMGSSVAREMALSSKENILKKIREELGENLVKEIIFR